MNLTISGHAVEQFSSRWRRSYEPAAAHAELRTLVATAVPTGTQTVKGDAALYLAISAAGERVPLVVRDGCVVTVLPRHDGPRSEPTPEASDDVASAVRELTDRHDAFERERLAHLSLLADAQATIDRAKAGAVVTPRALRRAHKLLWLPFLETLPASAGELRIEGGIYDGVSFTVLADDPVSAVVGRLLAAMRARKAAR